MSSKNDIINNIRRHVSTEYDMPEIRVEAVKFDNPVAEFLEISRSVGGDAVMLKEGEDINTFIRALYPKAVTVATNLSGITIPSFNPDETDDPHSLDGVELAIVKGEFGVAENGCVWIPQNVKQKALYFIAENLVIVLDKNRIVNNMHEAYERIAASDYGFGVYISGPSKTADIEQALVIGAHGAKSVMIILY
ncbi:MAG: LUD domain-containing protein [Prevotellaceae bacterium]|jgi:L-lactate dehydrogenase complex protein LldG|nr:LUD domain-containing protein [Prevotellaceae bacterium]